MKNPIIIRCQHALEKSALRDGEVLVSQLWHEMTPRFGNLGFQHPHQTWVEQENENDQIHVEDSDSYSFLCNNRRIGKISS